MRPSQTRKADSPGKLSHQSEISAHPYHVTTKEVPGIEQIQEEPRRPSGEVPPAFRVFETELGWVGFQASQRGITLLTFGQPTSDDVYERLNCASVWNLYEPDFESENLFPASAPQPEWLDDAQERIIAYAAGEPVDMTTIPCDLPAGTRFEMRVREQLAHIGYGQVITYGQLAEAAGAPRAARAVGSVMARNPIPLIIPCHRVVAADGRLGGYSAPAGIPMKERLLQLERAGVNHAVDVT